MDEKTIQTLIETALAMRQRSYAPYSKFHVGAALLGADGRIYSGCNIENAAFTPTNCAERTAFFKAVSEGQREFQAIAIAGGKKDAVTLEYCAPCGVCRQVMMEFVNPQNFQIILARSAREYQIFTLEQLLRHGFGAGNLEGE